MDGSQLQPPKQAADDRCIVRPHDVGSDLTVHAVIRNRYAEYAPAGGVEVIQHGVEFAGLSSTDSMILESLIYQQLVENPRSLA